jgi:hypothetical protein
MQESNIIIEADVCSICLEKLENSIHETECKDSFHISCISQWINQRQTCPICRMHISPVEYLNNSSFIKKTLLFILFLLILAIVSAIYMLGYNLQNIEGKNITTVYWMGMVLMQILIINIFTSYFASPTIVVGAANIYTYYSLVTLIIYCIYFKTTIDTFSSLHIVQRILIFTNHSIAFLHWFVVLLAIITVILDRCIERVILR